jgi:hypothetical protein
VGLGCQIISENKSFSKHRIDYVFRAPRDASQASLHAALCERVPPELRGEMDWEVE